ncbi:MAG: FtsK/SpoIIIE domain-containing protein [Nakamurella sp.]
MTLSSARPAAHAEPVPAFTLPLTVRRSDGAVRIEVRLAGPLPWSAVRDVVCRAAGLAQGTVLYRGIGPVEDSWIAGAPPLLAGCLLSTAPDNQLRGHPPLVLTVVAGPDAGRSAPITNAVIMVGRGEWADLPLSDASASSRHVSITPVSTGLSVADLGSTNGVFVDGRPVDISTIATTGSVIRVGNSVLQIQLAAEPAGAFRPDGRGHVVRVGRPAPSAEITPGLPERPTPPEAPLHRSLPLLSALIGGAVGGILAAILHNPMYLAFAALGPITMIGSAVSDRLRGRRSHRREGHDYGDAVHEWERVAATVAAADRRRAWRRWPGPAELVRRAEASSARLWTMFPARGLQLSVGCGSRPLRSQSDASGIGPPIPCDSVWVPDVPVTVMLGGTVGFVGTVGRGAARYLIAQVACHYSPSDVALIVVSDRGDLAGCRDLPHSVAQIDPAAQLEQVLSPIAVRQIVVILDGTAAMRSALGVSALGTAARQAMTFDGTRIKSSAFGTTATETIGVRSEQYGTNSVTVLCLADSRQAIVPQAVDIGAAVASVSGPITVTGANAELLLRICRALAPLRDEVDPNTVTLPDAVDLMSLTGPISEEGLRQQWDTTPARAILGYGRGEEVGIDLDADGPHLLIAGTTGSGKSELLQTLITSLAINSSPQTVTFLLVDYKGGSAFGAIAELPHVVGVLTDLDPAGSARALASMRAELRRREHLEADGAPRPARLIVVIDEFATLAAELPEFLSGVLDIAQRGRSLGLHLVLATQRPAGVVSPAMRANISARICLRVTDPAESLDVIGIPDAATLPASRPGRAICRVQGRATEFQTALSSVPVPSPVSATVAGSPQAGSGGSDTIMRVVIDAARSASTGMPSPVRPWLPPLPSRIDPADAAADVLAVADVPDQQCRRALTAPDASSLILGPPGCGHSTALRRIAIVAARAKHELIVIDGAGGLADLADRVDVSTYLTLREPRLVGRALALLADPTRRPRDGHLRHILIDHLDLVLAELERTDYATGSTVLTELITRGAGTVRISASGPERLRHQRVAAAFTEIIELGDVANAGIAGRGTWSGLSVQLVDAPVGSVPADAAPANTEAGGIEAAGLETFGIQSASARAPSRLGKVVVRPLPGVVHVTSLPTSEPTRVSFAVGGDAALPVTVDLTGPGGGIIVAGPRRSGVSNTLRIIAGQASAAGIPVINVCIEPTPATSDAAGVVAVSCRNGTKGLATLLSAHDGPLLLMADHHGLGDEHPAATLLEQFLAVCGAGQFLLVGARNDAMQRSRRGHLRAAASYRQGLLLAPDQADGAMLDLVLPRRLAGLVSAGCGVWAWNGVSVPVQVALAPSTQHPAVNQLTPAIVDSSPITQ